MTNMIDMIKDETIREAIANLLAEAALNTDNNYKHERAEEVAYWSYKLLEQRHLISAGTQQSFVDLIIGAALIHNMFIDEDSEDAPYMVFEARRRLTRYFEDRGVSKEYSNYIFKIIEGQFGEESPVPEVRPAADTPQNIVAQAKFIVKNLEEYDRWFMHRFYPELTETEE